MKFYELSDVEEGKNLKKFNDDIKNQMKKQEKPKVKPQDVFIGFKKPQTNKRKKVLARFTRKENTGGYY